jgi:periplasmic protein TonB
MEPATPPRPLPVRRKVERTQPKPIQALPLVATASEIPAPFEAPATTVTELPPIEAVPRQVVSAAPVASTPAVAALVAAAPAVVPPRFDAAYLQNPPPAYPPLARRMREQGRVLLRVLVAADGVAQQIELKTGSGSTRLDQAALDTVRRWRFVPARQGEQRVAAWVLVPISFSLES